MNSLCPTYRLQRLVRELGLELGGCRRRVADNPGHIADRLGTTLAEHQFLADFQEFGVLDKSEVEGNTLY